MFGRYEISSVAAARFGRYEISRVATAKFGRWDLSSVAAARFGRYISRVATAEFGRWDISSVAAAKFGRYKHFRVLPLQSLVAAEGTVYSREHTFAVANVYLATTLHLSSFLQQQN